MLNFKGCKDLLFTSFFRLLQGWRAGPYSYDPIPTARFGLRSCQVHVDGLGIKPVRASRGNSVEKGGGRGRGFVQGRNLLKFPKEK